MPRSLARLSASESSHRDLFSVVFITNIAESDFWYIQVFDQVFDADDMQILVVAFSGVIYPDDKVELVRAGLGSIKSTKRTASAAVRPASVDGRLF
jgi:hypothetical protein